MSDKPREWPNKAAYARDEAAELAAFGAKQLEPLLTEDRIFTESERELREKRAYVALTKVLRLMESQGARTEP